MKTAVDTIRDRWNGAIVKTSSSARTTRKREQKKKKTYRDEHMNVDPRRAVTHKRTTRKGVKCNLHAFILPICVCPCFCFAPLRPRPLQLLCLLWLFGTRTRTSVGLSVEQFLRLKAALVNKVVPCGWFLGGALEVWRLRLHLHLSKQIEPRQRVKVHHQGRNTQTRWHKYGQIRKQEQMHEANT